ncbi:hypothetical protein [Pelagibacterium lentulum]|uniref:PPM-type phosphatase domain-containing protein n=1 Tax=Pelagibacterium lentulum TaxID=2029865 RepID=A0A916R7H2_9HYPH|nr:hypothetical protein [Pelagibacterium lentulum]GGA38501.1 hypothetical protein GCM10011499_04880 [Pelagibacterium lentulum]
MNIELFSHSKYKFPGKVGDDTALIIPDLVYAVFDGATDPTGATYQGQSGGRIAARTAAATIARLASQGALADMPLGDVLQAISDDVLAAARRYGATHPPSTTAAIALDMGEYFRIILAGDTGIRINGSALYQHHKLIDAVSNSARIAIFKHLAGQNECRDAVEMETRSIVFNGLDWAVQRQILSGELAEKIIADAGRAVGHNNEPAIERFLSGGIRIQPGFANNGATILGFASLNGGKVLLDGTRDFKVEKATLKSLEIFSDGYLTQPKGTMIADWETEFALVEKADFHKIDAYPSVKGSTTSEFCDDRTVLSIAF